MPDDLRSLTPAELTARVTAAGEPRFRAEQIFRWLHGKGALSVDAMTNVPRGLRETLGRDLPIRPLTLDVEQLGADGTRKMRFATHDGRGIESVLIPEERHGERHGGGPNDDGDGDGDAGPAAEAPRDKLTLCVSSQVGCALDCAFCATATLGFGRNLTSGEILQQIYTAAERAGRRPTNLVFMGMGEPLHNLTHVTRAFQLLIHPWGAGFSPRRITVSTAGLVPGIAELGRLSPAPNLAISLNATTDAVRDRLMPINRKWPIADLIGAARGFPLAHGRKVTFEYVLLAGVNDSDADADRLPRLLKGLPCMVNLIPWNPFAGPAFARPSAERIRTFQEILRGHGMQTYIRTPRGDDIDAACGQLAARGQSESLIPAPTKPLAASTSAAAPAATPRPA
ncbi:MAG: 23S rRNA (adenine(2503)-C(2))-methyltransferase RlmN [Pseudomonadota bacterium]